MINLSYEDKPELYFDYAKGLKFLSEVKDEDHEYPSEVVPFHVYSEVKTD